MDFYFFRGKANTPTDSTNRVLAAHYLHVSLWMQRAVTAAATTIFSIPPFNAHVEPRSRREQRLASDDLFYALGGGHAGAAWGRPVGEQGRGNGTGVGRGERGGEGLSRGALHTGTILN